MISLCPRAWVVTVLLLAIACPAISYPIQSSRWIKSHNLNNMKTGDAWGLFSRKGGLSSLESTWPRFELPLSGSNSPVNERELSHRSYTPDDNAPAEPDVSVLIPVSPVSINPDHAIDGVEDTFENDFIDEPKSMERKYGQMLGRPETKYEAIHRTQSDIYSTSTFRFSSAHYVTFMSYRVSLPFLKFAPTSFPSFPLPGIFTTVIVLLVMVWIAILTIGLVEFGNYLWNGTGSTRDAEHRGADGEQGGENEEHELLGPEEMLKSSPQAAGVPMAVAEDFSDEASPMLTSRSNSDAGSDIEEYHPSI